MRKINTQSGFSILEIMVALAAFTIVATISAPNLSNWMRIYRLKGAAMELYSHMHMAKMNAVKENRPWKIRFDAGGSYEVIQCLNAICEAGNLGVDYRISKQVNFDTQYGNEIEYKNPNSMTVFENNPLVFNTNGLISPGCVYVSNKRNSSYYRVGAPCLPQGSVCNPNPTFAGAGKIQKWTGSSWE